MRRHARLGMVGALIATLGLGLASVTPASAQEPPAEDPVFPGHETPLPGFEEYAGCPLLTQGTVRLCIAATVGGTIQLGKVAGAIDDLHLVLGAGANADGTAVIVPAAGGGQPAPVPVPGGLLGIPELQPLLDLDVLHLLTLSATPTLGTLQQTGLDGVLGASLFGFSVGYPEIGVPILEGDDPVPLPDADGEGLCIPFFGCFPWPAVQLGMPLSLQLNNTLLGTDCKIGPIDVSVSDAAPRGSSGSLTYNDLAIGGGEFHIDGMHLVGSNFAVPGSDCAGLLGLGDVVDSLVGLNPFDAVIDAVAGLPSPAGHNTADLTVDLHVAFQQVVYGLPFSLSSPSAAFGAVPVGTSATQTVTITNRRTTPRTFNVPDPIGSPFTIVDNGCAGTPVDGGGSCTFTVRFTPTNLSTSTYPLQITAPPEDFSFGPESQVALSGTGTA